MSIKFKEFESKYDAKEITLADFKAFINKWFKVQKQLLVSSYDDYFVNDSGDYIRYRHRDGHGEMTIKRKLTERNNNKRIEVNLPTSGNNLEAVTQFAELLGYKHNFCIYKNSLVYWVDNMVICYYVVCDEDWKEKRRFVEIEADEDFAWESEAKAWMAVEDCEKVFEELGITAKNRLKKSLFEMFKQD